MLLPPYSYVSGRFPHPTRDPLGHSYGINAVAGEPLEPDRWEACAEYLYAVDLFNLGYYWEAHESWELLWQASGRRGTLADFLKGLIKLAAAGVKAREGRIGGVRRHAARAKQLFALTQDRLPEVKESFCGLSLAVLQRYADDLQRREAPFHCDPSAEVEVVLPVCLQLGPDAGASDTFAGDAVRRLGRSR